MRTLVTLMSSCLFSGPAVCQQEVFELLPSDGAHSVQFGWSVAVGGGLVAVGDVLHAELGLGSGAAYVFDLATGQELFELLPSDGGSITYERFGSSVSIGAYTIVVGAEGHGHAGGAAYVGAAYVFDAATGQELRELRPSDGQFGDEFGRSTSISGGLVVVGAPFHAEFGVDAGAAYLFDLATGQELRQMLATDGEAGDRFGFSVSLDGDRAVVGAPTDWDNGQWSGSAYVFDVTTGQQLFKLLPADGAAHDHFGESVSLGGNRVVIGAYGNDDNGNDSGSAYIFDVTTGQQLHKLLASDAAPYASLGMSVSVNGDRAVIGAHGVDDNGPWSGSAYVFDMTTGQQLLKLVAADIAAHDSLGFSVAASGDRAIAGAFGHNHGPSFGSAYVFALDPGPGSTFCFGDGGGTPCPCSNDAGAETGCVNSGGAGGLLATSGSASVSADDLAFHASNLLPSQPALLFAGDNAINGGPGVQFGDGLRCVGMNVVRLGVMTPDVGGGAAWGPGLGAIGGWAAGDTRYFQGWYRDPAGPCGTGFNLTQGVEVVFTL